MRQDTDSPRRGRQLRRLGVAAILILCGAPSAALERPVAEALDLSPEALGRFVELQDGWLEWLAAAYQSDEPRAATAIDRLLEHARALGMSRLPDLSLGAAGRAVGFAQEGRFDAARLCLTAAERLDSGRPEVSLAAARVARLEGQHWKVVVGTFQAYSQLFQDRLLRYLWSANLWHWLLFAALATGAIYVAVLMATRGIELFQDVYSFVGKYMLDVLALVITLSLLLWPLLLPAGVLWLVIYWSILLWGYGSPSQRIVLIGLWILLGLTSILINEQRQQVRVALAPASLSMESLASGRLRGSLFGDLAALREALPESTAVVHQLADLHCRLDEWASARMLYETVVEREPDNGMALLNLGVCRFRLGDRAGAMEMFQRAVQSHDSAAAARFNMSQVLSEIYRFDEAERELSLARELAPEAVGRWLRHAADERVVALDGGLARGPEIRQELSATWHRRQANARWSALWPRVLSLPLALAFILIAAALHFVVRRGSSRAYSRPKAVAPGGSWRSVLLVGLAEAEADRPLLALMAVFILVLFASLPLFTVIGYRLPWTYAQPGFIAGVSTVAAVAIFFLLRIARRRRGGF